MTKKNRLFLSLGSSAAVFTPLLFAASCGNKKSTQAALLANDKYASKRFDQTDDGKIKIGVTWSETGAQFRGFNEILKFYNETQKDNPNFLPVEMRNIGSGYGGGADDVNRMLQTTQVSEFYNLTFNYANVASQLSEYGMLLNFDDEEESLAIKEDLFWNGFFEENRNTSKIVNEGSWILPVFKSSQIYAVNGPVLAYVLETLEANGAEIKLENYSQIKEAGKADRNAIKAIYGEPRDAESLKTLIGQGYVVDQSTFDVAEKLFDFVRIAQSLFTLSHNNAQDAEGGHMFGIDDISGFLSTIGYSAMGGSRRDMFARVVSTEDDTIVDYSQLTDASSKISQYYSRLFNKMKEAMANGSLIINGGGAYSSDTQTKHKYMMSLVSTAGYRYNYKDKGDAVLIYKANDKANKIELSYVAGYNGKAFSTFIKDGKIVYHDGADKNDDYVVADASETKTKYPFIAANEETKAKLAEIKTKIGEKADAKTTDKLIILNEKNDADTITKLNAVQSITKVGTFTKKNANWIIYHVESDATDWTTKIETSEDILEKNELFAFAPSSFAIGSETKVTYVQGPSIIGIHANDREDKATKAFIKWLLTSKDKSTFNNSNLKDGLTPAEYVAYSQSYIVPIKGFEKVDKNVVFGNNLFVKNAFDRFIQVVNGNANFKTYSDPADPSSSTKRDNVTSTWKAVYAKYKEANPSVGDYQNEIIGRLSAS